MSASCGVLIFCVCVFLSLLDLYNLLLLYGKHQLRISAPHIILSWRVWKNVCPLILIILIL